MTPPPFDVESASLSTDVRTDAGPLTVPRVAGPSIAPPRVVARAYCDRDRVVRRLLALGDALALVLALLLAFAGEQGMWSHLVWGLVTVPVWLVICNAYGLYDRDIRRISRPTVDDLPGLAHALLLACLLMWLYYHVVPSGTIHFKHILLFGLIALLSALTFRTVVRRAIQRRLGPERALLIGDDDAIAVLADKLASHSEYGVKPVGLVCASQASQAALRMRARPQPPPLSDIDALDLTGAVSEQGIQWIVISHGGVSRDRFLELVRQAQELGVKVAVVPEPLDAMGPSVEVDNVEGLTVFGMYPPVLSRSSRAIKRSMDVMGSLLLLVVCVPLLALIACAIKLDSRGPVLFRQRRVGRGGRRFVVLKFRTMITGAHEMLDELAAHSRDPDWLLLEHDPRVTRVGRVLRRTSLDELPQAWNVLRGEMSLVGPRPLIESEDRRIRGWGRCRIDLTPGMTGLWQVLGRTSIPFSEMVTLDYLYVTNWSLWRDIKLLLSTVPALLSQRGAN